MELDSSQFFITFGDESLEGGDRVELSDYWHISAWGGHRIEILTEHQYGPLPVVVEVHDGSVPASIDGWDHIVELSVDVTADLEVYNLEAHEPPVFVVPVGRGSTRVRCHWGGLSPRDFDPDNAGGNEHVLIQVWPAPMAEVEVVLEWQEEGWMIPGYSSRSPGGRRQVQGLHAAADLVQRGCMGFSLRHLDLPMPDAEGPSKLEAVLADPDGPDLWWAAGSIGEFRTVQAMTEVEARALIPVGRPVTFYRTPDGDLLRDGFSGPGRKGEGTAAFFANDLLMTTTHRGGLAAVRRDYDFLRARGIPVEPVDLEPEHVPHMDLLRRLEPD